MNDIGIFYKDVRVTNIVLKLISNVVNLIIRAQFKLYQDPNNIMIGLRVIVSSKHENVFKIVQLGVTLFYVLLQ